MILLSILFIIEMNLIKLKILHHGFYMYYI